MPATAERQDEFPENDPRKILDSLFKKTIPEPIIKKAEKPNDDDQPDGFYRPDFRL